MQECMLHCYAMLVHVIRIHGMKGTKNFHVSCMIMRYDSCKDPEQPCTIVLVERDRISMGTQLWQIVFGAFCSTKIKWGGGGGGGGGTCPTFRSSIIYS